MMDHDEIQKAVEGVMALRPKNSIHPQLKKRSPDVVRRLNEIEFQQEMAAIADGELNGSSAYFFRNRHAPKSSKKNQHFNPYSGLTKK